MQLCSWLLPPYVASPAQLHPHLLPFLCQPVPELASPPLLLAGHRWRHFNLRVRALVNRQHLGWCPLDSAEMVTRTLLDVRVTCGNILELVFRPLQNIPHCCLLEKSGPCLSPSVADHPLSQMSLIAYRLPRICKRYSSELRVRPSMCKGW